MLRRSANESRATTNGSSVVPGFAKQTSMPALTAVATSASAPFMWGALIKPSHHHRPAHSYGGTVLLTYPNSGHGSLFQFHESFTRQAAAFLPSNSKFAPY